VLNHSLIFKLQSMHNLLFIITYIYSHHNVDLNHVLNVYFHWPMLVNRRWFMSFDNLLKRIHFKIQTNKNLSIINNSMSIVLMVRTQQRWINISSRSSISSRIRFSDLPSKLNKLILPLELIVINRTLL
jgi:hypothetical protein